MKSAMGTVASHFSSFAQPSPGSPGSASPAKPKALPVPEYSQQSPLASPIKRLCETPPVAKQSSATPRLRINHSLEQKPKTESAQRPRLASPLYCPPGALPVNSRMSVSSPCLNSGNRREGDASQGSPVETEIVSSYWNNGLSQNMPPPDLVSQMIDVDFWDMP